MNEAQMGLHFAVKGAKQVQKTIDAINAQMKKFQKTTEETNKKIDTIMGRIDSAGKKGKNAFREGANQANTLAKSLDKVAKKWLSIGGAITIVSRVIRKTFAKIDEYFGIKRMASTAGIAEQRIGGLGLKLKELGLGDASSAAGAYTSLGDILGAARSGRGISQDVVTAAARYGIALNGGMLTEDQLMTNIARAMKVQMNKGNMYAVRDIASAFGIDEGMMLHLAQQGANWDRNLPKYQMEEARSAAEKAKKFQANMDRFADWMVTKGLIILEKLGTWLDKKLNSEPTIRKLTTSAGKDLLVQRTKDGKYTVGTNLFNQKVMSANSAEEAVALWNSYRGNLLSDPEAIASKLTAARAYADLYNQNLEMYGGANTALNKISSMLSGVAGAYATLKGEGGDVRITIEDTAGALRNMNVSAKTNDYGVVTLNRSTVGQ